MPVASASPGAVVIESNGGTGGSRSGSSGRRPRVPIPDPDASPVPLDPLAWSRPLGERIARQSLRRRLAWAVALMVGFRLLVAGRRLASDRSGSARARSSRGLARSRRRWPSSAAWPAPRGGSRGGSARDAGPAGFAAAPGGRPRRGRAGRRVPDASSRVLGGLVGIVRSAIVGPAWAAGRWLRMVLRRWYSGRRRSPCHRAEPERDGFASTRIDATDVDPRLRSACVLPVALRRVPARPTAPTDAEVARAIARGVAFLREAQDADGSWALLLQPRPPLGITALAGLALLENGVDRRRPGDRWPRGEAVRAPRRPVGPDLRPRPGDPLPGPRVQPGQRARTTSS